MKKQGLFTIAILVSVFVCYAIFWLFYNSPRNLVAFEGNKSIIVKWDGALKIGLSHYEICRKEVGDIKTVLISANLCCDQFNDTSAEQNKKYIYIVRAVNVVKLRSNPISSNVCSWIIPKQPGNLKLNTKNKKAELRWDKSSESDVVGYNIYRSSQSDILGDKINTNMLTENLYVDDNFKTDGDYYYRVKAIDKAGNESNESESVTNLLKAPYNLKIKEGKNSLILTWDSDMLKNFSHYNIYRTINPSGEKSLLKTNVRVKKYQDYNTENDIAYYYNIRLFDKLGHKSGFSQLVYGKWLKPSPPANVMCEINKKGVQLNWAPNNEEEGVVGYDVYMGTPKIIKIIKINKNLVVKPSFNDYNIDISDNYHYYKIRAIDKAGNESGLSNDLKVNLKPDFPTGFNLKREYENQNLIMVIAWSSNNDQSFSHYEIYRSELSYPKPNGKLLNSNLLTNEYKDKDFQGDKVFYFVRIVNKLGIKSDFTRFWVSRDGNSLESRINPLLIKNYGEIP